VFASGYAILGKDAATPRTNADVGICVQQGEGSLDIGFVESAAALRRINEPPTGLLGTDQVRRFVSVSRSFSVTRGSVYRIGMCVAVADGSLDLNGITEGCFLVI
jgi:hypothetical protein